MHMQIKSYKTTPATEYLEIDNWGGHALDVEPVRMDNGEHRLWLTLDGQYMVELDYQTIVALSKQEIC